MLGVALAKSGARRERHNETTSRDTKDTTKQLSFILSYLSYPCMLFSLSFSAVSARKLCCVSEVSKKGTETNVTPLTLKELKGFSVPSGSIAVWWLGQAGFVLKSPQGVLAVLDPYLSDACGPGGEKLGFNHYRSFDPPIQAKKLGGFDAYVLTHSHGDHLDPETIEKYRRAGGKGPFIAPPHAVAALEKLNVPKDQIRLTWPGKTETVGDLSFRATLAIPFGDDDLTHVGYLVSLEGGPTLYFTGDTAYHEVLGISIAPYKPDVMFTVINGMWRNLTAADAAKLADQVKPRLVIPYHYDLFPDGQVPPHTLRMNLFVCDMMDRYRALERGTSFVCSKA